MSARMAVHSGVKRAFAVRVMVSDGLRLRTPFEGRENGVQCYLGREAV